MDKVKEAMAQRQALCSVHEMIAQQLHEEKTVEVDLQKVGKELKSVAMQEQQHQQSQLLVAKQRADLAAKQKIYDLLLFKTEQHDLAVQKQHLLIQEQVVLWRSVHKKQLNLPKYHEIETEKKKYVAQNAQQQKTVQDRLTLQETILKQRGALQQQKILIQQQYSTTVQTLRVTYERLLYEKKSLCALQEQTEKQTKELNVRSAQQEKERAALDVQCWKEKQFQAQEQQFEKRKNLYQQFLAKGNWLKAELDAIQQKHGLIHNDNPSCPMCEQNLSASRRKFLRNTFEKRKQILAHQYDRIARVVARLKILLIDQHKKLNAQKKLQEQRQATQKELAQTADMLQALAKQAVFYDEQQKKIEQQLGDGEKELKKQQAEERDALQKDAAYQALEKEVSGLEKSLLELPYDEKIHHHIQKKLQILEQQVADYMQVQHEIHNQSELLCTIKQKIVLLKQQKKELDAYQTELKLYEKLEIVREELAQKERHADQQYLALLAQKEKLIEQHGRLKSKTDQLALLKQESETQKRSINFLRQEIDDYQTIAAAVGKDGIQALLIEEAIPEIEQEANCLLSKLTNNQSQIFIESLRDLKSGGSKETLDVNIADPTGIRPYELFSGGEAFRIDFALRIAISKLLARRAGTALQTLIIDEGFGSQDEEGLSRIMDAIHKVQDDFEKVIIVSHLPGMRDQFPVHFVVEKGINGSCVTVVQQG